MAKRKKDKVLSRNEGLRESERQATSMALPLAVYRRLDLLAENAADVYASRSEIVGMLIAEASLEPEWVEQKLSRYRKLKVGDLLPDEGDGDENVVSIATRAPGRPPKFGSDS